MKNLGKAFDSRKSFFSNRSSAVFPLYLDGKSDLFIVFLNYWSLKNEIPADQLAANFRIYDCAGELVLREAFRAIGKHNQFSVTGMLEDAGVSISAVFEGMVEVEIVSTLNLRFPFPGLVGIYRCGDLYSCVHSSGRIKNSDEEQGISLSEESNWTCKFSESITPFFHFFVGPCLPGSKSLAVNLRNPDGAIKASAQVDISGMKAFSSRTFYADELFDGMLLSEGCFLSVKVEHNSVFPRLVVGNLFRDLGFREVTHSFPVVERVDHCPVRSDTQFQSMLCAYRAPQLDLSLSVFPTNCEGEFDCEYYSHSGDNAVLKSEGRTERHSTSLASRSIQIELGEERLMLCLRMIGAQVPSRFNASFKYRTRGSKSGFSTDIASGAKSCVYPPKYRHWGHAYVGEGFETVIMIRNNSHQPSQTSHARGRLSLYCNGVEQEHDVVVAAESAISLDVAAMLKEFPREHRDRAFISWLLEMDNSTCETFWVAYRSSDGAIFGEHGF